MRVKRSAGPSPSVDDVVAAAWALVSEEGPSALSMRALAARLGVSYQVVYSRVGGKGEIARALHDEGFRRLVAHARAAIGRGQASEQVIALAQGYLRFAVDHPAIFDVMFGRPVPEFERDGAAKRVEWDSFEGCFLAHTRVVLGRDAEPASIQEALPVAWRLWTAVHGITVLHLAGHDSPSGDVEAELAEVVRRTLSGS